MVIDADGPPCQGNCPNHGCVEAVASGTALGREAQAAAERHPDSALGQAPGGGRRGRRPRRDDGGDRGRRGRARRRCADRPPARASSLSGLANVFEPDVIVFGGGVMAAGELLLEPGPRGGRAPRAATDEPDPHRGRRARPRSGHDRRRDDGTGCNPEKPADAGPAHRLPDADREHRGHLSERARVAPGRGRHRRLRGHPAHRAPVRAPRISTRPRLVSNHEGNEAERARQLAQAIERGAKVALISDAGTPAISDPGYRLIQAPASSARSTSRCCPGPRP